MTISRYESPLLYYRALCAAYRDAGPPDRSDPYYASSGSVVLRSLGPDTLAALIEQIETALATRDEYEIRDMFVDGHTFTVWSSPDAATRAAQKLLAQAKAVKMG